MEEGNKNTALIKWEPATLVRVGNIINITNKIFNKQGEHYFNLGFAALNSASIFDKSENFRTAILQNPHYIMERNHRFKVNNSPNDYLKAIDFFTKAIENSEEIAITYTYRGIVKYQLKDYQNALDDFTKAIEIDPKYPIAYNARANAKRELKDYTGAFEDIAKAIEYKLNYENAYHNRGIIKIQLKDYQGAIEDCKKAIKLYPKCANFYNSLGNAKSKLNDYLGAIEEYTKAIEIDSKFEFAYNGRGNVKRYLKDYERAIEDYTYAIDIDPTYATAYRNRGLAKEHIDDLEGANKDFEKAKELKNENKDIDIKNTNSTSEKNTNSELVTDIDGNYYHTIKIGTQVWLVENLNVSRFRNGDLIHESKTALVNRPAWSNYANKFGKLYNILVIIDPRNICPIGWHIPTDTEWTTLMNYLGGEDIAGGKMKEIGINNWNNPNIGATNISGFTALPGGDLWADSFSGVGVASSWWSAIERNAPDGWSRTLFYDSSTVLRCYGNSENGLYVRCIKD